jgi:hypothetical protein
MSLRLLAIFTAVTLCCALPARAQGIKLRFHDGLVTLSTQNAPLRAILSEWARQGGTTIVNADRVSGPPMSLELNAVSERQALDVLLRSVSGYMLAPRPLGTPGISVFDRIMILPTSSAPPNAAAGGRGFPSPRPVRPPIARPVMPQMPEPTPEELLEEEPPQDIAPEEEEAPVVTPQLRPRPPQQRVFPGLIPGGQAMPFQIPEPEDDVEVEEPDPQPQPAAGNPFGIPAGASSRPGVVTPVPQRPQQRTPRADPEP